MLPYVYVCVCLSIHARRLTRIIVRSIVKKGLQRRGTGENWGNSRGKRRPETRVFHAFEKRSPDAGVDNFSWWCFLIRDGRFWTSDRNCEEGGEDGNCEN